MTDLKDKILIDTNIIVYSYDFSEPQKQKIAIETLDSIHKTESGVLSSQILAEFFSCITKKIAKPLSLKAASEQIELYILSWTVIDITPFIVREAVRGVTEHRFSFWDSMIWATARMNQIPIVLSEDFSNNSVIEGIRFINPFIQKLNF